MDALADIMLAVKCAPDPAILDSIERAGIEAVELYTSGRMLKDPEAAARICAGRPLRFAVHAPNEAYEPQALAHLARATGARVVVMHGIYFDDEWPGILDALEPTGALPCVENVTSILEPTKLMRRYAGRVGLCLDLEHVQMECGGLFEEEFLNLIPRASHIHLTGYSFGTELWHTHLHHNPVHARRMLGLIRRAGYEGLVVSESRVGFQTLGEFSALKAFFDAWRMEAAGG